MAGAPVATENYTLKKSSSGYEIDGSGSASLGTMKIDIERFEVLTDAKYRPLQAIGESQAGPDSDERERVVRRWTGQE